MQIPPPLTSLEIEQNFDLVRDPPPPGTFELGLVVGGTVSAGAYTAGFLDGLVQAMDEWDRARATDSARAIPDHRVSLDIVTGTSGGGVNASVLARAIAFGFPHVTSSSSPPAGNPFWDLWVEKFDIGRLLKTQDIASGSPAFSLLDSTAIDDFAKDILAFGAGAAPMARSWVKDPFRLILTLTNLPGVPYILPMRALGPMLGEYFVNHADHARFAVSLGNGAPKSTVPQRPYETMLPAADMTGTIADAWARFGEFAKGTAAFPLGFAIRNPVRQTDHYRWRVIVEPAPDNSYEVLGLTPAWQQLAGQIGGGLAPQIATPVVDGGAMNNEPIELARTWLAGLVGRNPRASDAANRAIVLVDPLANSMITQVQTTKALDILSTVVGAMIAGARYETADLLLMADPTVFSRYLVTPSRNDLTGDRALAGGGFGAFMGFLCRDFRVHDFMRGRADCHEFLLNDLAMSPTNPIFADLNGAQIDALRTADGSLRLIPLLGAAAGSPVAPAWPQGKLTQAMLTNTIQPALSDRLAALLQSQNLFGDQGFLASIAINLVEKWGADAAAGYLVNAVTDDLATWGLS